MEEEEVKEEEEEDDQMGGRRGEKKRKKYIYILELTDRQTKFLHLSREKHSLRSFD